MYKRESFLFLLILLLKFSSILNAGSIDQVKIPVPFKEVDEKGNIITLSFGSNTIPENDSNSFYFSMFPEISVLQPKRRLTLLDTEFVAHSLPLNSQDLKSYRFLRELNCSSVPLLKLAGIRLDNLTHFSVSGQISGLEELDLPKLEKLSLFQVVPMADDEIFRLRKFDFSQLPKPFAPGKVLRLSPRLPSLKQLRMVGVSSADFDYNCLASLPLTELTLEQYDGENLDFLKSSPIQKLTLLNAKLKNLDVLESLDLKELVLDTPFVINYDFLKKLKLQSLQLRLPPDSNFQLDFLKDMPLEVLYLMNYSGTTVDFTNLAGKALREVVLINVKMESPEFLEKLPLKKLALIQCTFHEFPFLSLGQISSLEMLNLGLIRDKDGEPINFRTDFCQLSKLDLKALAIMGNQLEFCRSMEHLESLKIILAQSGERSIVNLSPLKNKKFQVFLISHFNHWKESLQNENIQSRYFGEVKFPFFMTEILRNIPSSNIL